MAFQLDLWFSIIFFVVYTINAFCKPFNMAHNDPFGCALGIFMALPAVIMSINMKW